MIASNPPSSEDSTDPGHEPPRGRRLSPILLGVGVGLIMALLVGIAWALLTRDRTPELTDATLDAASALWDRQGPRSYNLDLAIEGRRAGAVHVEVRDGEVTAMTRDGHQPSQQRTWYPWSVPGQFDTMSQELEMAQKPAEHFQANGGARVILRAKFDPRYGYPLRFERIVLGSDDEIRWKTTRFEVLNDKK